MKEPFEMINGDEQMKGLSALPIDARPRWILGQDGKPAMVWAWDAPDPTLMRYCARKEGEAAPRVAPAEWYNRAKIQIYPTAIAAAVSVSSKYGPSAVERYVKGIGVTPVAMPGHVNPDALYDLYIETKAYEILVHTLTEEELRTLSPEYQTVLARLKAVVDKAESPAEAALEDQLVELLLPYAGQDGAGDEGAVDCLKRILKQYDGLRKFCGGES